MGSTQICDDQVAQLLAGEGEPAGEAAEDDDAERPQVAAGVDLLGVAHLLRAHVLRRADHHPRHGRAAAGRARLQLGDAEVEDLHRLLVPLAGEEDVGRLEVAVDQPRQVGGAQAPGDLVDEALRGRQREAALVAEPRLQLLALEQLHGDEGRVSVDAVVEDADEVRAVELRRGLGLTLEAGAGVVVLGVLRAHQLDGDVDVEMQVPGHPHGAHAAVCEHALEAIPARDDTAARQGNHSRSPGAEHIGAGASDAREMPGERPTPRPGWPPARPYLPAST